MMKALLLIKWHNAIISFVIDPMLYSASEARFVTAGLQIWMGTWVLQVLGLATQSTRYDLGSIRRLACSMLGRFMRPCLEQYMRARA